MQKSHAWPPHRKGCAPPKGAPAFFLRYMLYVCLFSYVGLVSNFSNTTNWSHTFFFPIWRFFDFFKEIFQFFIFGVQILSHFYFRVQKISHFFRVQKISHFSRGSENKLFSLNYILLLGTPGRRGAYFSGRSNTHYH